MPISADPTSKIAPNFALYELTKSETVERQEIDNWFPSEIELQAAVYLCREVLQFTRNEFGPITPNSVFRSQELERALKGKPSNWKSKSQHTTGCACDVEVTGMSTLDLANWLKDNLSTFDQIICECYDPSKGPNAGWVHVSVLPASLQIAPIETAVL